MDKGKRLLVAMFSLLIWRHTAYATLSRTPYYRSGLFNGPFKDHALVSHVISSISKKNAIECSFECLGNTRCVSYNLRNTKYRFECQLNDKTRKTACNADYQYILGWHFYEAVGVDSGCHSNPCLNGGICRNLCNESRFVCSCSHRYTGKLCETAIVAKSCTEWKTSGSTTSAIERIDPDGNGTITTYCDQTTDGGGWALLQRRFSPFSFSFTREWADYVTGFGNLSNEFWIGLDNIYRLTRKDVHLRIELRATGASNGYIVYRSFKISDKDDEYRLDLVYVSGNLLNSFYGLAEPLHNQKGFPFSTKDNDNDGWAGGRCTRTAGWWFNHCGQSNLNTNIPKWYKYPNIIYSQMKIR